MKLYLDQNNNYFDLQSNPPFNHFKSHIYDSTRTEKRDLVSKHSKVMGGLKF